jgi:uncharacterized protein (DUF342 family)
MTVNGNLEIRDYVLDATCIVKGDARVEGGKGLIAGGEFVAGRSIVSRVLGTSAHVPTKIYAGYDPELKRRYEKMALDMVSLAGKLENVRGGLKKLRQIESRGPLGRKQAFIKERLLDAATGLEQQACRYRETLEALEARFSQMQSATVQALGHAHPNTTISIDNAMLELSSDVNNVQFVFRQGEVVLVPLES